MQNPCCDARNDGESLLLDLYFVPLFIELSASKLEEKESETNLQQLQVFVLLVYPFI